MGKVLRFLSDWRLVALFAILSSPLLAPELLAFPHVATSNGDTVYSVKPIDKPALDRVTRRANALVAESPLARPYEPRTIFLTDGGWRWSWLAVRNNAALALTRPGREAIIINTSDLSADGIATAFGQRTLSGVIAHEKCHGLERRRFGLSVDWRKPQWLREGYCDYVALESTLSDAQAQRLEMAREDARALTYWQGRRKVAAQLAANGGDVAALFANN